MEGAFRPSLVRPGKLWKSFFLEAKKESLDGKGKPAAVYETENPQEIRAVLASASPREMAAYQQTGHPVSHVITHRGTPLAKPGDRFIYGKRAFYVQGVDNPGELGVWALYYCEERAGVHNGNGHHS